LVAVNCAALPEGLAEGELFGYRRGAFTGADRASPGFFRSAEGGTLLLDEVSDLPLPLQAKLLRVLQEGEVQPLGETRPVPVDVRIVVASQQSLMDAVRDGRFRADLLARLDGVTVRLPPLRTRKEDVPPHLFSHLLRELTQGRAPAIEGDVVERLCLHDWPFNVRELVQLVRQFLVLLPRRILAARTAPAGAHRDAASTFHPGQDRGQGRRAGGRRGCLTGGRHRGVARAHGCLARLGRQRRARIGHARYHPPAGLPADGDPRRGLGSDSRAGGRIEVTGPPRAQRVGEIVGGKYRLLRYLAAGGMGAVYEAVHTVVGRRFAIKLLHPELAVERDSLARFQREAQAAGAIENENVAAALDFGIAEDGSPFIVMELLAGESLRATIDSARHVPLGRAADIVMQACRGVAAAHRAGIVHRDLNPQNLFVCRREDGTDLVKVLDFGIAKLEAPQSAETRTGTVLGTPAYLSPEQARGEKTVDHHTDIYGLGAILYEFISGQKPHPGDSHNAILHHICTQPALPLDTKLLALPAPLVASVEKALSSDPRDRQESAEALGQELAAFATREVWPAPRGEGAEPSLAVVASTPAGKKGAVLAKVSKGRRRAVVLAAVLTLVALAAVVAAYRATRTSPVFPVARPLAPDTRFFVPPPNPAAIQQIAAFVKSNAVREAAMITAIAAIPQAVWFAKGTPEEVQSAVGHPIVRAVHDRSLPVLVAYNRPYRDCAGFSAGGAKDSATYQAWLEGLARGIGNERALLILEPDGLGILPYNTSLDGAFDWCKPTVTDARGNTVPAPGATADEIYAQSNRAVATLRKLAPNALVYLDGAHAGWLPVGEAAYRLYRGGVLETQGFAVNVSNSPLCQPTHARGLGRQERVGANGSVVCEERSRGLDLDRACPLRDRHGPQRARAPRCHSLCGRAVCPARCGHPRPGCGRLVQPARHGAWSAPEHRDGGGAAGRVPVDQNRRRIGRIVRRRRRGAGMGLRKVQSLGHCRRQPKTLRSPVGHGRSGRGHMVPGLRARARAKGRSAALALSVE
jgi:tRNA A-37 threonylcarbamoyl transferase component Bud32